MPRTRCLAVSTRAPLTLSPHRGGVWVGGTKHRRAVPGDGTQGKGKAGGRRAVWSLGWLCRARRAGMGGTGSPAATAAFTRPVRRLGRLGRVRSFLSRSRCVRARARALPCGPTTQPVHSHTLERAQPPKQPTHISLCPPVAEPLPLRRGASPAAPAHLLATGPPTKAHQSSAWRNWRKRPPPPPARKTFPAAPPSKPRGPALSLSLSRAQTHAFLLAAGGCSPCGAEREPCRPPPTPPHPTPLPANTTRSAERKDEPRKPLEKAATLTRRAGSDPQVCLPSNVRGTAWQSLGASATLAHAPAHVRP